jgi:AcrR family transcriptional regulator
MLVASSLPASLVKSDLTKRASVPYRPPRNPIPNEGDKQVSTERITKAAAKRDATIAKAHGDFRTAVVDAHGADGLSVQAIATAAGLTRQRVYQLLEPTDVEIEARIADIQRRWDATVAKYGEQWESPALDRVMQAKKNGLAKKRARKGLPRLPTVAEERTRYAEKLLLAALASEPDCPVFVSVRNQLAEWDRLAALLERRRDKRSGIFA